LSPLAGAAFVVLPFAALAFAALPFPAPSFAAAAFAAADLAGAALAAAAFPDFAPDATVFAAGLDFAPGFLAPLSLMPHPALPDARTLCYPRRTPRGHRRGVGPSRQRGRPRPHDDRRYTLRVSACKTGTSMPEQSIPLLSAVEARVLGVLVEKQLTVPDIYPLTLNALLAGCNQKTSRDPVMALTEGEVRDALERLRRLSLVIESSGSRVMRYSHNAKRVLGVPTESVALLATLMLRGPQTAAELRANAERLQRFSDASALEAFLEELAAWPAGALVERLARQPGAREQRWAQLLCGAPAAASMEREHADGAAAFAEADSRGSEGEPPAASAQARFDALEARIAALEATVRRLCAETGVEQADSAQGAGAAADPAAAGA
jgi:uncharacterized protein YceH (UPF0502 family)